MSLRSARKLVTHLAAAGAFNTGQLLRQRLLLLLLGLAVGCGGEANTQPMAVPTALPPANSGLAIERWFPLVHGHIYQYATRAEDGAEGLLLTKVVRSGTTTGTLHTGNAQKTFQYLPDGVQLLGAQGSVYVLRAPIAVGTSWHGQHGGQVKITQVGVVVEVPAGRYQGCAISEETRGGDVPLAVKTTFCPDVGIVLLEAQSGGRNERAALRSYGPPVDLGPDGVQSIPASKGP